MGFSAQQNAFISTLAGHTGLNPGVVAAWVAAEEPVGASSGYRGTQDWLNVGITDSGPMGAGNSVWRDPVQAGVATANWIRGTWSDPGFGHAAPGIQAIIRTAGQAPGAQIRAIQNSGWASGGYSDLGQLYGTYAGQAPKPSGSSGAPAPAPAGRPQAGMPSSTGSAMVIPTTTFDKAGYTQAQHAYTAGTFLSQLDKSNPYNIPVKGEVQTSDPVLASGLLTTTAPDPANFVSAQLTLQKLAGGKLTSHPAAVAGKAVLDAKSAGANADAQKLLGMLHQVQGASYSQANHDAIGESAQQVRAQGTDCSGLISWLMGPNGLGIWHSSLATPDIASAPGLQAGRGAVVTVWNNKQAGNAGHVFIQIGSQFFGSEGGIGVHQISAGAAQNYIQHGSDGGTYQALHPTGA